MPCIVTQTLWVKTLKRVFKMKATHPPTFNIISMIRPTWSRLVGRVWIFSDWFERLSLCCCPGLLKNLERNKGEMMKPMYRWLVSMFPFAIVIISWQFVRQRRNKKPCRTNRED